MGPSDVTPAMVKTEVLDTEPAKIVWHRFNFPWCTGYLPKRYRICPDLIIQKDPNNFRPHRMQPILLFNIEANMHNKHLKRTAMSQDEALDGISPEKCGISREKEANIKELNTRLFYDLIRQKIIPAISVFSDIFSNYNIVVCSIVALSPQRVDVPDK